MAALPDLMADPTLEAADAAIEAQGNREPHRPYLGMSEIGRSCSRALWYGFRWCSSKAFDAATLKRFEDGHRGEDIQAARLRQVDDIELLTIDPRTGRQFGFADHGGHFRGHMDGSVHGLLQAPKTWHVWEHKQTDEKKQTALVKAKQEHGEKGALAAWDAVYHGQAMLYMAYSGMTRHYLTCATPGGRRTVSCRTNADGKAANALKAKALKVIQADVPLARVSDRPDWYECKWCAHHAICHGDQLPEINCRTCLHATPELDGDGRWSCARFGCNVSVDTQRKGERCPEHRYIPALIPFAEPVDADDGANWVEYVYGDGDTFRNGGPEGLTSSEMRAIGKDGLVDAEASAIKKPSAEPGAGQAQASRELTSAPWSPAASAATSSAIRTAAQASAPAPWMAKA